MKAIVALLAMSCAVAVYAGEGMEISSPSFRDGESLPLDITCGGPGLSPKLDWKGIPETTKSLAVVCDDPDAPRGTWTHWVIYSLPPSGSGLESGLPPAATLPGGVLQGTNDYGKVGYDGPCPPPGKPHRYYYRLYALDILLELPSGARRAELQTAMRGHILAEASLMGTFRR